MFIVLYLVQCCTYIALNWTLAAWKAPTLKLNLCFEKKGGEGEGDGRTRDPIQTKSYSAHYILNRQFHLQYLPTYFITY